MSLIGSTGRVLLLAAAIQIGLASTGGATVIGGGVTGGNVGSGGMFEKLILPFNPTIGNQNEVGDDNFNTDKLYAFDESQNILISVTVAVNVGTAPTAGDVVASHYVFFDPAGRKRIQGFVDFDADIFGIVTSRSNLLASDPLQNVEVVYADVGARGLEGGDSVAIDPSNPRRLLVDFTAGTPGDYVRVLTMESTVPEPNTAVLLGMGLIGIAVRRRGAKPRSS